MTARSGEARDTPLLPSDGGTALVLGTIASSILKVPDWCSTLVPVLLGALFAHKKRVSLGSVFPLKPVRRVDLVFPGVLGLCLFSAEFFSGNLLDHVTGGKFGAWSELFPFPRETSWFLLFALAFFIPAVEEVFFRGFFARCMSTYGPGWTVFAPALIFAAAHHPAGMIGALLFGILAGTLFLRSGSLLPPMVFHVTVNLLAVIGAWAIQSQGATLFAGILGVCTGAGAWWFRAKLSAVGRGVLSLWRDMVSDEALNKKLKGLLSHWSFILILLTMALTLSFVAYKTFRFLREG